MAKEKDTEKNTADELERKLKAETEKWLEKAKAALKKINVMDKKGQHLMTNAHAYLADSQHFLEKNDLIRAFEAIIWSWAFIQIGKDLRFFEVEKIYKRKVH